MKKLLPLILAAVMTAGYFGYIDAQQGGSGIPGGSSFSTQYKSNATSFGGTGPGAAGTVLTSNGAGSAPTYQAGSSVTPAALSRTSDTNVTLTLGGTPTTALLQATSITAGWTGTLAVTRGGTGLGTFTQGDLVYSSAANTLAALAKDANATRYLSNQGGGNNPSWNQVNLANGVTGTLPTTNGGSGLATYAQGDILYASAADTLAALAKSTSSTRALCNTGASNAPAWCQIGLTTGVTGTLPVANGGTNLTGAVDDNVMVGNGTTWETKTVPNCTDTTGNHLNYTQSTNAFSCGTSGPSGSVTQTSGNFTLTFDDACTTSPTMVVNYTLTGNLVTLRLTQSVSCTSDSVNFKDTTADVPASLRPTVASVSAIFGSTDNANAMVSGLRINTDGTAQFCVIGQVNGAVPAGLTGTCVNGNWTNSGTKAVAVAAATSGMNYMTYMLN